MVEIKSCYPDDEQRLFVTQLISLTLLLEMGSMSANSQQELIEHLTRWRDDVDRNQRYVELTLTSYRTHLHELWNLVIIALAWTWSSAEYNCRWLSILGLLFNVIFTWRCINMSPSTIGLPARERTSLRWSFVSSLLQIFLLLTSFLVILFSYIIPLRYLMYFVLMNVLMQATNHGMYYYLSYILSRDRSEVEEMLAPFN